MEKYWGKPISTYTSKQAIEDGFLFDIDILIQNKHIPVNTCPIKYMTAGLLEKGYRNNRCVHGVNEGSLGIADRCGYCEKWLNSEGKDKLDCIEPLNIPNILDLIVSALKIYAKKPKDDYFVSGRIELPNGSKQEIFIAQNETGRYTAMLPEDY